MKPAWFVAFALPVLSTSLLYPQANPASPPPTNNNASEATAAAPQQTPAAAPADNAPAPPRQTAEIVAKPTGKTDLGEAELKARLMGRPLFLRGLWLGETLHFNMNGDLVGQAQRGRSRCAGSP